MANFNNIKHEIDQNVNTNGVQAITGAILNETLKDMIDEVDAKKQDTLVAGQNITISGNVISATGGGSGPTYTAGQGIDINQNNVISVNPTGIAGQGLLDDGEGHLTLDYNSLPQYVEGFGINITTGPSEISVDASDLAGSGLEVDEFGALKTDPNVVQPKLTAGSNITISGNVISATGTTYSQGHGIDIDSQDQINVNYGAGLTLDGNDALAVDTTTIQPKLTAGSGISISAQNVISATGGGGGGTTYGDGDAIHIDSNDNINVLYGSGLQLDGNGNLEVDPFGMPFLPLAGGQLQDDPNNTNSTDLNITSPSSNAHIDVYTEDDVNPGDGTAYVEVQDSNGTAVYGSDGITNSNGGKLYFPQGSSDSTLATSDDLSYYLRNDASGQIQNFLDGTGDTELTVMDGMSEDYVRLGAYETQGEQPHIEIFENGSGDTKFFYDHIERGSQVSIDLPSQSGTLALTSDIPTASSLAGNGLQDDGNGALEIDTTVVATQSDLSDYLPLTGGTLNNTGQINTNLSVQSPNSDYHVNTYVPNSGSVEIEIGMSSGHAVQNPSDGDTKNLRVYKDKVDLYTYDSNTSNWRADSLYFPKKKTGTIALDSDLAGKQDTLVSGTNIKTVNGNSLLGSGDITISGGQSYTAGNGIDITSGTISVDASDLDGTGLTTTLGGELAVDTTVIQEKLTAGSGISISAQNVISATGGGGSGLWTNGTGTNSLMAPESVSSGATASGTGALNAGYFDSVHPANPSGASGNYSAVFGTGTRATSDNAFVTGEGNAASGQRSFVGGGVNNVASGRNSAVIGGDMGTAAGENSVSIAGGYAGPGNSAVAIRGTASATGSISINGTAAANTSVAIQGGNTYSGASGSVAIIGETDGQYSVALGRGTHATNTNEVATGSYNKTYQSLTASTATSFTVGNGVSGTPSNALEFKQNSDAYLYGVGNYDGTNAGASGVQTLQDVINNGGGGGTSFTPGDALELDQNDNLNVLYGSGLTLNGNNELEVDPSSISGFLPLDGGVLHDTTGNTQTALQIDSPLSGGTVVLLTDSPDPGTLQGASANVGIYGDVNGTPKSVDFYHDRMVVDGGNYSISYPTVSADDTLAVQSDLAGKQDTLVSGTNIKTVNGNSLLGSGNLVISGGQSYVAGNGIDITNNTISVDNTIATVSDLGGYLPLTGGTLQEDPNDSTSTELLIQSPETYATADLTTVDLDPGNTPESLAKLTLSDYDSSSNPHTAIYGTDGISNGTYKISFPTLTQDDTFALLSDVQGGGGTSYTAGTGISISAQNVISNSAPSQWTSVGTDSLYAGGAAGSGGQNSIAFGYSSKTTTLANQKGCVAIGYGVEANHSYEVALGVYNRWINQGTTAEKTHFTIGNGSSTGNRLNSFEIKQNNDAYLYGIGGFTGANAANASTLQTVINGKQDTLTAGTGISISGNVISATGGGGGGSSLWTSGTGSDSLVAPGTITAGLSVDPAQGTGAISCGYDTNADGDYAFASGGTGNASGDYSFAANNGTSSGDYSAAFNTSGAYGDESFAAGTGSTANATSSIALAGGTTLYDDSDHNDIKDAAGSVAIGSGSTANAHLSIAIGSSANTSEVANSGIAIGTGAYSNAQEAVAIGSGSTAEGLGTVALSSGTASGERSTAMSSGSAIGDFSIAGGTGALTGAYSSVALGFQTMTYDQGDPTDPSEANAGEAAFGRYNYTEQDFIFSVGCGQEIYHDPDDPDFQPNPEDPDSPDGWTEIVRQNAITITTDGSIYIKGAGGYLGQGITGADSLQTLLYNLNPQ